MGGGNIARRPYYNTGSKLNMDFAYRQFQSQLFFFSLVTLPLDRLYTFQENPICDFHRPPTSLKLTPEVLRLS